MYKHLLIATDGSELSKLALQEGVALAKALGAHVTAITVTPPFHMFTSDPAMVADTAEQYRKRMAVFAERIPRCRKAHRGGGGRGMRSGSC